MIGGTPWPAVPLVLPFGDAIAPDLPGYRRLAERVIALGAGSLVVNSATGEGFSLWPSERRDALRAAVAVAAGRVPVIATVVGTFTEEACGSAEDAAEDGADALVVPLEQTWWDEEPAAGEVVAYLDALRRASGLPVVVHLSHRASRLAGQHRRRLLDALGQRPFVLAVAADASDARTFAALRDGLAATTQHPPLVATDDLFAAQALGLGADGLMTRVGSVATAGLAGMHRAARTGDWDLVARLHGRVAHIARAVLAEPARNYRARIKEILVADGVFARADVRPPLAALDVRDRARLIQGVAAGPALAPMEVSR